MLIGNVLLRRSHRLLMQVYLVLVLVFTTEVTLFVIASVPSVSVSASVLLRSLHCLLMLVIVLVYLVLVHLVSVLV